MRRRPETGAGWCGWRAGGLADRGGAAGAVPGAGRGEPGRRRGMRGAGPGERCAWARRRPQRLWAVAAMGRESRGPYAGPANRAGTCPARCGARWAPCSWRLAPWELPKASEAVDPQPYRVCVEPPDRCLAVWGALRSGALGVRPGPAVTPHARPGRPGGPARRRRALEEVEKVSTDRRRSGAGAPRGLLVGGDPVGEFGPVRADAKLFEDQGPVVGSVRVISNSETGEVKRDRDGNPLYTVAVTVPVGSSARTGSR